MTTIYRRSEKLDGVKAIILGLVVFELAYQGIIYLAEISSQVVML